MTSYPNSNLSDFFSTASHGEILRFHAQAADVLRLRGLTRSANNPVGDFAEGIFCRTFGWKPADSATLPFDATDEHGIKYQIKGRRVRNDGESRQLSAIRDLEKEGFDFIAAIIFGWEYQILSAIIVPRAIVKALATFQSFTNSHRFMVDQRTLAQPSVKDVTALATAASTKWLDTRP